MARAKTFSTDDAVRWYLPLMHELAIRIELVAHACEGRLSLTPPYAREYAYLQFRRMCELIALGCLRLHGDLPQAQTESARKEWNAHKIMSPVPSERGSFAAERVGLQPGQSVPAARPPPRIGSWSQTSLQQRLVKTGGRLVQHS